MEAFMEAWALDWHKADWRIAAFVFVVYFALDAMYVHYTLMITGKKPLRAANISFVMHLFLAGGVLTYTHNPFYILPLAMGSWAGTYWFTWRAKRMDKSSHAEEPMLPSTRTRLLHLLYATNRCTDGDVLLRFASETIGRPLAPRDIDHLAEQEAMQLMVAFERTFPDTDADVAEHVVREVSGRP